MLSVKLEIPHQGHQDFVIARWRDPESGQALNWDVEVGLGMEKVRLIVPASAVADRNPVGVARASGNEAFRELVSAAGLNPDDVTGHIVRAIAGSPDAGDLMVRAPEPLRLYGPFALFYRGVEIRVEDNFTGWTDTELPLFRADDKLQAMIWIAGEQAPLFISADADDPSDLMQILGDSRNDRIKALVAKAGLDPEDCIDQTIYHIELMREEALHQ